MITIKKKIISTYIVISVGIMLFISSCVREEGVPCPNYLRIMYDYNMEYVDQFHTQVTFLSIFMFDAETGVLVREVKQKQDPFPEKYTMEVPSEWFGQNYDIVIWAGLNPDSYEFSSMTPGVSTIEDFQLKVKDYQSQLVNRNSELEPLWYGTLSDVRFDEFLEKTYTVSLMKDTKKFRIVVQSLDEDTPITTNDLDIHISSANGWYDNSNTVLDAKDREIIYKPYYFADDPEAGVIAEMNSLRLINDDRINKLQVIDKADGKPILDISLIKYINALRLLEFSSISLQEYLDREDNYYILIFLKNDGKNWVAAQIKINDWIIRTTEYN